MTTPTSETGATVELPQGVEPSLNELFERNPLEWDDSQYNLVIQHMREARKIFHAEDTAAKKSGRRVNAAAALGGVKKLSLADLGL